LCKRAAQVLVAHYQVIQELSLITWKPSPGQTVEAPWRIIPGNVMSKVIHVGKKLLTKGDKVRRNLGRTTERYLPNMAIETNTGNRPEARTRQRSKPMSIYQAMHHKHEALANGILIGTIGSSAWITT